MCTCIVALCAVNPLSASAQAPATSITAESERSLAAQKANVSSPADVTRQKREQAYVKLLASQRLVSRVRNGELNGAAVGDALRQAQTALLDATKLDPTLAEAHTLMAEIALYFPPPDIDAAVRYAKAAIGVSANNFGGHQVLSRIYSLRSGLGNQRLDKPIAELAIIELREVTRLAPNDAEGWALLGEFYLALGRTSEAIQALTRWSAAPVAIDPRYYSRITGGHELTNDAAAARLGEAYMEAGRVREAFTAFRRALSWSPENEKYFALLGMAIDAGGAEDSAALVELRTLSAENPKGTNALILLARALARLGRFDEAVRTLLTSIGQRAESDKENIIELRMALAQIYANASRYSEAIATYEDILKVSGIVGNAPLRSDSDRLVATQLLRRILDLNKRAGNSADAIATIERMRRILGGNDPTIELENIALLRELGMRREALQAASAARSRFPQQVEFVFLEAAALTELGRVDEGVALLRGRLSQNKKPGQEQASSLEDFDLLLRISSLYTQAGRGTDAVSAARQAIDIAPADRPDIVSIAYVALSSAQERAGDFKGSEESLRRVLASEPNNPTALNNLGYFLVERNERLNEALEMIQRSVRSEPSNSSFLDSLGWVYFKLGQLVEAERYLTDAARLGSGSATIQEHLGDLYASQGKKDQARVMWEKSLKLAGEGEQANRIRVKLGQKPK